MMKSQENDSFLNDFIPTMIANSNDKVLFLDCRNKNDIFRGEDLKLDSNLNNSRIDSMQNLASNVLDLLKRHSFTIATAESCTGGLVAYQFSAISGASEAFLGGVIAYQNIIKSAILGVKGSLIESHTPYSIEVVNAMLKGAINAFNADFAIATSGVAGPSGGSEDCPVGSVYIGVAKKGEIPLIALYNCNNNAESNRTTIQRNATKTAMELAYRYIAKVR